MLNILTLVTLVSTLYWSSGLINAPDFVELCPVLVYILNYKRFQEPVRFCDMSIASLKTDLRFARPKIRGSQ
jgi:hypothetical protein